MKNARKKATVLGDYVRVPEPAEPPPVAFKMILKRPETLQRSEHEANEDDVPPLEPSFEDEGGFFDPSELSCYAVEADDLPANFPDSPVPYFEEPMRQFKLIKTPTKRYVRLSQSWAYEMRKRIDANEETTRILIRTFAIHRRAFNMAVVVLWKRYGRSLRSIARNRREMNESVFEKLIDPKGRMMRADPWFAKFGDHEALIRSAVVEAVDSFLASGPEIVLYKSSPRDDSESESVWINLEKDDGFEDLKNVRLISETGDIASFDLKTRNLNRLFCVESSCKDTAVAKGFFLVRKGQDSFFVAYRFNDHDASMRRVTLNAVAKCYVIPSPFFVGDESAKACVVAFPSMNSHLVSFVYSPSHAGCEGIAPARYVKTRFLEDKKELIDELTREYNHLIFYDREDDQYIASIVCGRYYEILCSPSATAKSLTFVKERKSYSLCSSCHGGETDVTNQYFVCRTCGNTNSTDVNLAFSIWMKWCWGVVDRRSSGFVSKKPSGFDL